MEPHVAEPSSEQGLRDAGDEQLWQAYAEGDAAALRKLVDRHSSGLYWYLLLSTGQMNTSVRFLAETWCLGAYWRGPLDGFGSFREWLFAVATQNLLPPTHPEAMGLNELIDDVKRADASSRWGEVFYQLMDLRRFVRQPFLLVTVAGLGIREAARVCKFTPTLTARRVQKAYDRLARSRTFRSEDRGRHVCRDGSLTCRQARVLAVARMFGDEAAEAGDSALVEHLALCGACAGRVADYVRIRDEVAGLRRLELPEQAHAFVADRAAQASTSTGQPSRPPATPDPARSARAKALIFAAGMFALAGTMVGLLVAWRAQREPIPAVGTVVHQSGEVWVHSPGMVRGVPLERGHFLAAGTTFITERNATLAVRGDGVEWRLDESSSLKLEANGGAHLLGGRLWVGRDATGDAELNVVSPTGTLVCPPGSTHVVSATTGCLRAACLAGRGTLVGAGGRDDLVAGQLAFMVRGACVGAVLPVREGDVTHWLRRFTPAEGTELDARGLASVRTVPDGAALADGLAVERVELGLRIRGALATVRLQADVRNLRDESQEVRLSLADALLPVPLAAAEPAPAVVAPGESLRLRASAVCLMPRRDSFHSLGLNVQAWTASPVGDLVVQLDADADGGLRNVRCPLPGRGGRRTWCVQGFDPSAPLVFEFRFWRDGRADAVRLSGDGGTYALVAWRPDPKKSVWLARRNVFIAFDAGADFGPGGRARAHEFMEALVRTVPAACRTALLTYGDRLSGTPVARHLPWRVDAMMTAVWEAESPGGAAAAFLGEALERVSEESVLLFVTGRDTPDALEGARVAPDVRLAIVQLGAAEPARDYVALCRRAGGVAIAVPDAMAPDAAAWDVLAGLHWPAWRDVTVSARGGRAELLTGPTAFAHQPVAALAGPVGGGVLSVTFNGRAAGREMAGELSVRAADVPLFSGKTAEALLDDLRRTE